MLAAALRGRGVDPQCTQIIGHSLGTLIAAQAAVSLSDLGPMAQLTLLDPPTLLHEELFCKLTAQRHACLVENYWAPGISGLGSAAHYRGVHNYELPPGEAPVRGILDLSVSNHVYAMLWYYRTMANPAIPGGFQTSQFSHCGCPGGCQGPAEVTVELVE
jgi:pimeloyl-ACP methyl ester carboxylesterase